MPRQTVAKRSTRAKCPCGCGQAPADTTRLRKASCGCGYVIRLSRECIGRGAPGCPCGFGSLEPDCLLDRCYMPGEAGADAAGELDLRDLERAVRREPGRRDDGTRPKCGSCHAFRRFDGPCRKCGDTAMPDTRSMSAAAHRANDRPVTMQTCRGLTDLPF